MNSIPPFDPGAQPQNLGVAPEGPGAEVPNLGVAPKGPGAEVPNLGVAPEGPGAEVPNLGVAPREAPAQAPAIEGWRFLAAGKVRDVYELDNDQADGQSDQLLVVTTDRISAYDYILPTPIPDKGKVLTALSVWWMDQFGEIAPNHLISLEVPEVVKGRAMIVQRLAMFQVECVARGYLTGSGLKEYQATGRVTGIELPAGLQDGDRLPQPIFTPATKAEVGQHDENVPFDYVVTQLGQEAAAQLRDLTMRLYAKAHDIALERGLILADTKFEFGADPASGQITLGDEVLTPDSSRYWDTKTYQPGGPQPSFDKQYLRDWLTHQSAWDKASPPPPLPEEVVAQTRARYIEAYQTLTGQVFA
ncbi:MAG: phosphoribosylaminoimidazolesuccinocarboxamide synthase [Micrococcales bacterium]|nr:phosphoribosylaminoimidazolesuccinocarboxamide synthase [Micrococcales bacterium]